MARKFYKEDNGDGAIEYATTAPTGMSEITDPVELRVLLIEHYEQRSADGVAYLHEFQADLMLAIGAGTYTIQEVTDVEDYLMDVISQITAGSWLTAQNTIGGLGLSGIFTQTMKDKITADINNYVLENY